ncbi:MAG: oxidoreductase [Betaproteobacteria bacterium]|nr:oxidoreductase [Betaproteobacteria bacterium]MBI2225204.1 oxidoreductase [Betaproteobacteria bacterium]MBI2292206.1 oxidoreductase [Betaproteobacteria bacterium]MBI3054757.1 oxidoreductase [Betaproteobacteria bacterium]
MKKWNLIIDVARCNNCNNCFLANKDEHVDNDFPGYAAPQPRHGHRWIDILRRERGRAPMVDVAYLPTLCNHCDDAPCVNASRDGAVYKRPDGIVIIDPQKAAGKKEIVGSCPYGAIWWNEERQVAQTWIFDAHLLDQGWQEPRCAQVCPTAAIRSLKAEDSEMQGVAESEALEVLHPELGTKPRVYYKNLYRYTKCFIGGSVAVDHNGVIDCLEGADVTLSMAGAQLAQQRTDNYGDFKFDRLNKDSGTYAIEIFHPAHGRQVVAARSGESQYLGTIYLK